VRGEGRVRGDETKANNMPPLMGFEMFLEYVFYRYSAAEPVLSAAKYGSLLLG